MPSNNPDDDTERVVTATELTSVLAEGGIVEVLVGCNWKKAILGKPHKDKKWWCVQVCPAVVCILIGYWLTITRPATTCTKFKLTTLSICIVNSHQLELADGNINKHVIEVKRIRQRTGLTQPLKGDTKHRGMYCVHIFCDE